MGIGLIGSSLARCLKQNGDVKTLAVYDENSANLQKARELDLADIYAGNLCEAVKDADLVVFATPVCAFGALARESAPFLKKEQSLPTSVQLNNIACAKWKNI